MFPNSSPRRRLLRAVLWGTMVIVLGRFVIVASSLETGWETVATQWQNALLGWMGFGHTSVGHEEPGQQAEFWLASTEQITHEHPDSAAVHIGAAWVLDSPGIGFMEHYWRQEDELIAVPQFALRLDEDRIAKAKKQFREACTERCLAYAARATKLAPNDLRWWRMRALLLFEGDSVFSDQEFEPRSPDWQQILQECSQHDPENALYDYLMAMQLWNQSAAYDWPADLNLPERWQLSIKSPERFAEGERLFDEGQNKQVLAIGEVGYPAIAEFLSLSGLKKQDQLDVALSRLVTFRHSLFVGQLCRWQSVRADDAASAEDPKRELQLRRQSLHLWEQASAPKETSALSMSTTWSFLRQEAVEAIVAPGKRYPELLPAAELAAVTTREAARQQDGTALQTALQDLEAKRASEATNSILASIGTTVTSTAVGLSLLLALVSTTVARALASRPSDLTRLPAWSHVAAWTIGCGGTYVVLGMAPAEVIPYPTQTRVLMGGIWILAVLVALAAIVAVIRLLRRRQLRFSLAALFAVMTGTAVMASLWPAVELALAGVATHPPELWLHAKGWNDVDPEVWRSAMKLNPGSWLWATIQWLVHGGIYVGIGVSLLIATLLFMRRRSRQLQAPFLTYWRQELRVRWAAVLRFAGKSAGIAGLVFFMIYFSIGPSFLREAERDFQYQMRYCRDPAAHYNEIIEAQNAVATETADTPEE